MLADSLLYYGFITETSSHYNPIWINPIYPTDPDDDGGGMCLAIIRKKFDTKEEALKYVKEKRAEGYATVSYKDADGKYVVEYDDGK